MRNVIIDRRLLVLQTILTVELPELTARANWTFPDGGGLASRWGTLSRIRMDRTSVWHAGGKNTGIGEQDRDDEYNRCITR